MIIFDLGNSETEPAGTAPDGAGIRASQDITAPQPARQVSWVGRPRRVSRVTRLYVQVAGPRPDFRLVLAFVWGDADCDTDGNSRPASSREWTELYAQNRGRPDEVFNVFPASVEPLVLQVQSEQGWLAAVVAHLLAETTGGGVSD